MNGENQIIRSDMCEVEWIVYSRAAGWAVLLIAKQVAGATIADGWAACSVVSKDLING